MSPAVWAARFDGRVAEIADSLVRGDPRPLLAGQATGQELDQRAAELASRNDLRALAAAVRSLGAMTLTPSEIAALAMPTLVIVGSEDLPPSRAAALTLLVASQRGVPLAQTASVGFRVDNARVFDWTGIGGTRLVHRFRTPT